MEQIKISDRKASELQAVSSAVSQWNSIVQDMQKDKEIKARTFGMFDTGLIEHFHILAHSADPKSTVKDRLLAWNLYTFLAMKRQNNLDMTEVELAEKNLHKCLGGACYMSMDTLAKHFGYKKEESIRPAVRLLVDMNLIIVQKYGVGEHQKYAFYVLNLPDEELCKQFPSQLKGEPKKSAPQLTPIEAPMGKEFLKGDVDYTESTFIDKESVEKLEAIKQGNFTLAESEDTPPWGYDSPDCKQVPISDEFKAEIANTLDIIFCDKEILDDIHFSFVN